MLPAYLTFSGIWNKWSCVALSGRNDHVSHYQAEMIICPIMRQKWSCIALWVRNDHVSHYQAEMIMCPTIKQKWSYVSLLGRKDHLSHYETIMRQKYSYVPIPDGNDYFFYFKPKWSSVPHCSSPLFTFAIYICFNQLL